MLFKPVQLGREALDKDVLIADRKSCKRFGPCGVGEKALYLSSFYRSCRYYLPYGGVTRGFKRGLLLPDLEGGDTVFDQIAIAKQKAGIAPDEDAQLERFEVVRHTRGGEARCE